MIPQAVREAIQTQYRQFIAGNDFRPRGGQRQMIAAITQALWRSAEPAIAVVEAGTGTGKTLAYLLPALATARAKGKHLVVSTATVALQEQLIAKDLPAIKRICELDFTYALAKGRGRYACNLKLEQLALEGADLPMFSEADSRSRALYIELQDALLKGDWDGDRDHWVEALEDRDWRPLITDRYQCLNRRCPKISECAFFQAREELESVDCLITNHDLVLSDLSLGGGVILPAPEDSIYVFDEAHHLEDKARNHFASSARLSGMEGLIEQMEEFVRRLQAANIPSLNTVLTQLAAQLDAYANPLSELRQVLVASWGGQEAEQIRFAQGRVDVELRQATERMGKVARQLHLLLADISAKLESLLESAETLARQTAAQWMGPAGQLQARLEGVALACGDFAAIEGPVMARWLRLFSLRQDFTLNAMPLQIADLLSEHLWSRAAGAVLTSATLASLGSFGRLQESLGLPQGFLQARFASPFDFAGRAELVIPPDCPEAGDVKAHDAYLKLYLAQVLERGDAASLVLFASDRQMQEMANHLADSSDTPLLVQGSFSKQEILRRHRERIDAGQASIIFGLASFAEGIDLPGDYCTQVIIAKIPFPVPDDPVVESLGEWMQAQGRNAFGAIMLPAASLALVQAAGRLMRSEQDSGRVVVLDRRLLNRAYGRQLLNALPPFKRVFQRM